MAGSPNAFANPTSAQTRPPIVLREQDHNARPPKRARFSEVAVAAIHTQCADAETSVEVDHMILDYVAHQTIRACLGSRNVNSDNVHLSLSNNLAMSDSFMSMFKARHADYTPDPELRLRSLLLKLTTLFTQRLTSNPTTPPQDALVEWRSVNRSRATRWWEAMNQTPISQSTQAFNIEDHRIEEADLERNRAHVLHELGIPAEDEDYEDAHYGTMASVSLLDLLPLFMQVSAARNAMSSSNLTKQWMRLAGEFMLQACLERYLVFGTGDDEDEAFAWGYLDGTTHLNDALGFGMTGESILEINAMFEDEDYETEVGDWNDVKTSFRNELLAPSKQDLISHLETVATNYPIRVFETSVLKFMEAISNSIPEPVLMQLEKGKLDGLTKEETKQFLDDCGVAAAKFFEAPVGFKAMVE